MVIDVAIHVSGARIYPTRILAALVNASFVRGTIRVTLATKKDTGNSRVASIPWWTLADSFVVDTIALSVFSAGGD